MPGAYTVTVTNQAAAGFYTDALTQNVPATLSGYPASLTATGTLTADPLGSISATVTSAGGPVAGATVTVTGGPRSVPTQTATTNASGIATFSGLPAGAGYTVTATKGGQSAPNQSASVSGGSTTNLSLRLPDGAPESQRHLGRDRCRGRDRHAHRWPGRRLALGNLGRQR